MQMFIKVVAAFVAFHRYPEAPDRVSFLRNNHRHNFIVKLMLRQSSSRSYEFFLVQEDLKKLLHRKYSNTRSEMSCEDFCVAIRDTLTASYGYPLEDIHLIEVSEDGENGAVVVWE